MNPAPRGIRAYEKPQTAATLSYTRISPCTTQSYIKCVGWRIVCRLRNQKVHEVRRFQRRRCTMVRQVRRLTSAHGCRCRQQGHSPRSQKAHGRVPPGPRFQPTHFANHLSLEPRPAVRTRRLIVGQHQNASASHDRAINRPEAPASIRHPKGRWWPAPAQRARDTHGCRSSRKSSALPSCSHCFKTPMA